MIQGLRDLQVVGATPIGGFFKMTNMGIKEAYSELKKKYRDLPNFDDIDNEFEISAIEEPVLIKAIRRKITEKTDYYAGLVKDLLQPESDMTNMYECRAFGDDEKEDVYNILKKLMFLSRLAAEVALKADEKEDALFISSSFKEWIGIKPKLLRIISKIRSSWEKDTDLKEDLGYFG